MEPFGAALRAFDEGDAGAELLMHRDDGFSVAVPVAHFFRPVPEDGGLEAVAIGCCSGRVLDCGAGTGRHAFVLQERGLDVTAIDLSPEAVEVMSRRGVRDARRADALSFEGGPFDTLLLLGHSIGMVETIAGLGAFMSGLHRLVAPRGQVLLDSLDVRSTAGSSWTARPSPRTWSGRAGRAGCLPPGRAASGSSGSRPARLPGR